MEHVKATSAGSAGGSSGRPARNILIFSDGTGNSSAKLARTNVWKAYKAVDLEDPQSPKPPRQFAFYDDGVGTSSFRPLALLGGAFGVGLARNVRDLYAFVCRTYQPGDKIYAFGFSRGAFTVRVAVGLMMNQGLVPYNGNEADLQRNVAAAYRAYRRERFNITGGLVGPLRWLRDQIIDGWNTLRGNTLYANLERIGLESSAEPLEVEFIGVWDTVAAYGLPVDELTRAVDDYIWPLSMPDRDLSYRVKRAMHALSLDDERNTFHPQLWNEAPPVKQTRRPDGTLVGPPNGGVRADDVSQERLSQVWFAGVHSDVGGGYTDDGVGHVSLDWIMTGAERAGVRFQKPIWDEYRALSDENGPINDSRAGLAGYYRYNPRRIERLADTDEVKIACVKVHESVLRRIKVGQDGYAPIVPPPGFDVMRIDGRIEDGGDYLKEGPGSPPFQFTNYKIDREHVFNMVWWRRIAYFVTLGATLLLAAMPLLWPALPGGACQSRLCFLSDLIDPVQAVVPSFMATWIDTFSSRPDVFAALALVIVVGLYAGGALETAIRDAMRSIWYDIPATRPLSPQDFLKSAKPGAVGRFIESLRLHPWYRKTFRFLTHTAMPFAFLLAVAYGAAAVLGQSIFAVRSSWGGVCKEGKPVPVTARTAPLRVRTDSLCASTGLRLDEGSTYRITIAIPPDDAWLDRGLRAGPLGVDLNQQGAVLLAAGVPLRRHVDQPWFKPMARIGPNGSDHYPLNLKPSLSREDSEQPAPCSSAEDRRITFASEIVARSTGELFFYVNDAVALPPFTEAFYRNNRGSACLTVQRVTPEP